MIQHCVYCAIPASVDPVEQDSVFQALAAIMSLVDGFESFACGPNRDYENKSAGYTWGFAATFRDRAALAAYDAHPAHKAAGGRLVDLCDGGGDGIMVFDLETR